jgi:hypothetical protein
MVILEVSQLHPADEDYCATSPNKQHLRFLPSTKSLNHTTHATYLSTDETNALGPAVTDWGHSTLSLVNRTRLTREGQEDKSLTGVTVLTDSQLSKKGVALKTWRKFAEGVASQLGHFQFTVLKVTGLGSFGYQPGTSTCNDPRCHVGSNGSGEPYLKFVRILVAALPPCQMAFRMASLLQGSIVHRLL